MKKLLLTILGLSLLLSLFAAERGKVYLVVGSDTSIWDGLSTGVYGNRYFLSSLYSDPSRNGFAVMDTSFRYQLRDSYGTHMKISWWMMAGNVFELSKNCNIPIKRNVTLYLMKKYHHDAIDLYDDQLTLHYHTYYWSDPDGDGIYAYEIAPDFLLNLKDYEKTLNTFLIEDDVFPISFRSGWMYMDEHWQDYQERFIPFDMSDCWTTLSNGSVPFHPNADNYRLEGNMEQWRVRSVCFTSLYSMTTSLNTIFDQAAAGNDQMLCLWSHLPQTDFLTGLDSVNNLAHRLSEEDSVDFLYCKDVEAMRLWIDPDDTIPPILTVNEIVEGNDIRFDIETDGPVFQSEEPYVALKTMYETYERLSCTKTGENRWETIKAIPKKEIAKIAVAVCDSVGNQTKVHLDYVPDDIFIDEKDNEFLELAGVWSDYTSGELWNLDARLLNGTGSFTVTPDIPEDRIYNIFFHGPGSTTDSARVIVENSSINDTITYNSRLLGSDKWQYAGFHELESGSGNNITFENLDSNLTMGIDVVRISPLIADKHLKTDHDILTFDDISLGDSATLYLGLSNVGKEELEITSLSVFGSKLIIDEEFPLVLQPMEIKEIPITFTSESFCEYNDVICIKSDDPQNPLKYIPVFASSLSYYRLIDNDDAEGYTEYGPAWFTSTAVASKSTSRCIFNHTANFGAYADFSIQLELSGRYDIRFIVPKTSNAHKNAAYILIIDGTARDTVYIDQNT
ncbi:MAG: hypothetical protein J7M01_01550, partial [Candidatus Marinimicrobia bacterium]|nr:hypothetical protein [Candidatus Neomarinimicrobiota bacterium]